MTDAQDDCIFCKIASGALGTELVHETATTVAFNDLAPLANKHILIVPKRHIGSLAELSHGDDGLLGDLMETARIVAGKLGIADSGYRVLTNVGPDAGQTVFHLHWHLLGGEPLGQFGRQ